VSDFLFAAHSGFRYVVLTVGVGTAAMAAAALIGGPTSKTSALAFRLFRVYVVAVDIQVMLGLSVVFTRPFQTIFIGHLAMMALSLATVHGVAVYLRKRPSDKREPGPILAAVAISLGLIAGGIMAIGRPIV